MSMDHPKPFHTKEQHIASLGTSADVTYHGGAPFPPGLLEQAATPSDPLADAVRALKMAELALMSNLAGVTARRAEIKKLRGDVARLYLEAVGRKARTRKAGAK